MAREGKGQGAEHGAVEWEAKPTTPTPAVFADDHIGEAKDGHDHGRNGGNKRGWLPQGIKPAEWIMIIFTAVTAAAGWGSVVVADGQWEIMRKQLAGADESSRQAERAIDATTQLAAAAGYQGAIADQALRTAKAQQDRLIAANERLSAAAQAQAAIGKRGLIESNRAWIGLANTVITKREDHVYEVDISVMNTGRAPATNFARRLQLDSVSLSEDPGEFKVRDTNPCAGLKPLSGGDVIYPSSTIGKIIHSTVTSTRDNPFYIHGCFVYETLGVTHYAEFCELLDVRGGHSAPVPLEQGRFTFCVNGNRAD